MIPPYEMVSLLQLGISDASVFRNIISNEIILDKKFNTFFTVDGLIEIIVFLSDKITRVSIITYSRILIKDISLLYYGTKYSNKLLKCVV